MLPVIATDYVELNVTDGEVICIPHGLGRQVGGWLVVWKDAPVDFTVHDAGADSAQELVLIASGTARARIVLL